MSEKDEIRGTPKHKVVMGRRLGSKNLSELLKRKVIDLYRAGHTPA